jgi:flagellar basal-body rod modification protein FlgD
MELAPTTNVLPGSAKSTASGSGTDAGALTNGANEMAGDFETFLTLLTTQLRNQDPLKPMESTEFVAQLASFSAVEQQVRANDKLDVIAAALGGGATDGLAAWIGKDVRAPGKGTYAGVPMEVGVTPLADVDQAVLVVRNDFGQVVARRTVESGEANLVWDGTDTSGRQAAAGVYSFALDSYRGEEMVDSQAGQVFSTVSEVRFKDGAPVLLTDAGAEIALADVTALR